MQTGLYLLLFWVYISLFVAWRIHAFRLSSEPDFKLTIANILCLSICAGGWPWFFGKMLWELFTEKKGGEEEC